MKLWIDDVRPAPEGYVWCKSVFGAIKKIQNNIYANEMYEKYGKGEPISPITLIDIDHDAGDYYQYGGDYIQLLNWLEEKGYNYPIHIHSMNPVGIKNMRAIIRRNDWKEI